jgi:hypothetical protein
VAGSSARAKARRLGISDEKQDAKERHARAAELKPRRQTVHLLGRDVPVLAAGDGTLRADDDGKPASDKSVQSYIARAFGDRLAEARGAMDALAVSLPLEELNRVGFRLYERFRPDVPEGAQGCAHFCCSAETGRAPIILATASTRSRCAKLPRQTSSQNDRPLRRLRSSMTSLSSVMTRRPQLARLIISAGRVV